MPILVLLFMLGMTLSQCTMRDSYALTTMETTKDYGARLDANPIRDEVKQFICSKVECPTHVHVDEVKITGRKFAALHVSANYNF